MSGGDGSAYRCDSAGGGAGGGPAGSGVGADVGPAALIRDPMAAPRLAERRDQLEERGQREPIAHSVT